MVTETGTKSTATLLLGGAVVALAAGAAFLYVNGPMLPSAEENTLAQAQGPMGPPARLPTAPDQPGQEAAQAGPAAAPEAAAPAVQEAMQEPPPQDQVPQGNAEPASQPRVTRLPPANPGQTRSEPAPAPAGGGDCNDPEYAAQFC